MAHLDLHRHIEGCHSPQALCDVIHQCLAFNPQQRPEQASEVQGTLDHLADELVRTPEDRLEALEF